jgi:hypothetical protein
MKPEHDEKSLLVEDASSLPCGSSERPEIRIPEVFHDDKTSVRIVPDQPGHRYVDLTKKCRNVSVVRVLYTLRIVMDEDR